MREKLPSGGPQQSSTTTAHPLPHGLAARVVAVTIIAAVLRQRRALDEAIAAAFASAPGRDLEARDKAFARLVAVTVVRRTGELKGVLGAFLAKPLPDDAGILEPILLAAAAQLLLLETPPHAAISLAVDQCRLDPRARRFDKLANAVLRRVASEGAAVLATIDRIAANVPEWLLTRWQAHYGPELARAIAAASLTEPALDLSIKSDAAFWHEQLGGTLLATGTLRLVDAGRVDQLPGYAEGAWWVQDAAARLPVQLFGDVKDLTIADLCAAPGGKTAELAALGARVTALDKSEKRIARVRENMDRLRLTAELVVADATEWKSGRVFDGVLVDAPCSSTGTIRRHPDILHMKRPDDIERLAELQVRLLDNAARLVKPGGLLVYCTCSLEPEEGETQLAAFLAKHPDFARDPVKIGDGGIEASWITPAGELRTLPQFLAELGPERSGMDGFFASRLRRHA